MSKFNKFKRREPPMDKGERDRWNLVQDKLLQLGFEQASLNPVDIMFAREASEVLWELDRFSKTTRTYPAKTTGSKPAYTTGMMNLDPIGVT